MLPGEGASALLVFMPHLPLISIQTVDQAALAAGGGSAKPVWARQPSMAGHDSVPGKA